MLKPALAAGRPKLMTLEEWADLDEDVEGELVDGVLEEEEMPSLLHELTTCGLSWMRPNWTTCDHDSKTPGAG